MPDVSIERTQNNHVTKQSLTSHGNCRLRSEIAVYERLLGNMHIPNVISSAAGDDISAIRLEYIDGENLNDWLGCDSDYATEPRSWAEIKTRLEQYVAAETSLLDAGVLYRDLNFEHVIFRDSTAYFIDLEAALVSENGNAYSLTSTRGTWETMAPEEFSGMGALSERTATYRAAVIAHIALCGRLPYRRDAESRSKSYELRSRPLQLGKSLSSVERKLFSAALSREPMRRHKNPRSFINALDKIMTP